MVVRGVTIFAEEVGGGDGEANFQVTVVGIFATKSAADVYFQDQSLALEIFFAAQYVRVRVRLRVRVRVRVHVRVSESREQSIARKRLDCVLYSSVMSRT